MDAGDLSPPTAVLALEPPFEIRRPPADAACPLVFASPHSGRHYPEDMGASALLGPAAMRSSEDALVDHLLERAPLHGCTVLLARYARAYVDVNREPYELDPSMFLDDLPEFARARTARVAAGLGSIARLVAEGREIYDRKLTFAEASRRSTISVSAPEQVEPNRSPSTISTCRRPCGPWHAAPGIECQSTRMATPQADRASSISWRRAR